MIAIQSELGEFTGETLAQATKALRAAQSASRRKAQQDETDRKQARRNAESTAYRVYRFAMSRIPDHWIFRKAGEKYGPRVKVLDYLGHNFTKFEFSAPAIDGDCRFEFTGWEVVAHLEDAAGHVVAFWIREEGREELFCQSPGFCNGISEMVELPGVAPEMFASRAE